MEIYIGKELEFVVMSDLLLESVISVELVTITNVDGTLVTLSNGYYFDRLYGFILPPIVK